MKIIQRWRDFKEDRLRKKQQNVDIAKLNVDMDQQDEDEEEDNNDKRVDTLASNKKRKRDYN